MDCLSNKLDEISLFLDKNNIDVAFITETNPKNNRNTDENNRNQNLNPVIEGYKCEENPSGRVVCMFYKEYFDISRLKDIESLYSPSLFCKFTLSKDSFFHAGLIYRSPNCTDDECKQINDQITTASKKKKLE